MRYPPGPELPPEQERANRKAIRLEWITLAYWASVIVALYFTLGQSQAMKAAWVEDILATFAPAAFLVASRYRHREPSEDFPWGYHRAITVAYLVAATALFGLGIFIAFDSIEKLITGSHPTIGMVEIFDFQIWLGWLMLVALAYSVFPTLILGRIKQPVSAELHDKVLFADAETNKADWMTALAAAVGVVGIGFGLWWADAVAAIFISVNIVLDGSKYLRGSVADLMDGAPTKHDEDGRHPLVGEVERELESIPWARDSVVRLRESGHVFVGDVVFVPAEPERAVDRVEELTERLREFDWRLADIIVSPVRTIEGEPGEGSRAGRE
jgi:cation diffusion facilitator family transporter